MNIKQLENKQIKQMQDGNVWHSGCPVSPTLLRSVEVSFVDFEGERRNGVIVVHQELARCVANIFRELEIRAFPIQSISPMERYNGEDERSMAANNTSGYNGRAIARTDRWSSHAYGAAIDINPVQNPYLKIEAESATIQVYPTSGVRYVNRNISQPGMVEDIVSLMAAFGFTEWGGKWNDRPDYHHFQLPWDEISGLAQS